MDRASVLHRAGSYLMMFLGAQHLAGHLAEKATPPATPAAAQLEVLLREVHVTALGVSRSMEDVIDGHSLAFALFAFLVGVLALLVDKYGSRELVTATRVVCAGLLGVLTGVGLRSWVPPPVMLSAVSALCFVAALAVAKLEPSPSDFPPAPPES
jgi:hypothetical protein